MLGAMVGIAHHSDMRQKIADATDRIQRGKVYDSDAPDIITQLREAAETIQQTPHPDSEEELRLNELKRRFTGIALFLEHAITPREVQFSEGVIHLGITEEDTYQLEQWLQQHVKQARDNARSLWYGPAASHEHVKSVHLIFGQMIESCFNVPYRETITYRRGEQSCFKNGTIVLADGLAIDDLLLQYTHEAGHALQELFTVQHTQQFPYCFADCMLASTMEHVADLYQRALLNKLERHHELLDEEGIPESKQIMQRTKKRGYVRVYDNAWFECALLFFSGNMNIPHADQRLATLALDEKRADAAIQRRFTPPFDLIKHLTRSGQPVERALRITTGKVDEQYLLSGYRTPQGLIETAEYLVRNS